MTAELVPVSPGTVSTGEGTPIVDPYARWLGSYSDETQSAYRRDFKQWLAWMETQDVSPLEARVGDVIAYIGYLRSLGLAKSSQARKVSTIASYFEWAREEGITANNPMPSSKRRPKAHKAPTKLGLTREETHRVLGIAAAEGARTRALVTMLLYTGIRISEATGLDVTDLVQERGRHVLRIVGKGDKHRTVPATGPVMEALDAYLQGRDSGPMFITAGGGRLDRREGYRVVRRIGRKAELALHPHLFRHTVATLSLDAGAPVDRVQRLMGHSSLDTTMGYVHARDNLDTSPVYDLARHLAEVAPD